MSALSLPTFARQGFAIPPIVHGNRYELECECARSLLAVTCAEQEGRLHMLTLLSAYFESGAGGRKRQFVAKEMRALRDLYEAVWYELGSAFSDSIIRSARETVEHKSRYDGAFIGRADRSCLFGRPGSADLPRPLWDEP